MKLNLGCGTKLYSTKEGWINVDIVEPKGDHKVVDTVEESSLEINKEFPFIFHRSDLKDLRWISDNVADEIHGYHIIEHFFRDEVPEVLKEWKRVLKPGGKICLEQPDVLKCAANFIAGALNGDSRLCYNLGFLGFYGDGTSKEPYMGHKWGWHPQTLIEELKDVGFVNCTQKPSEHHMKDIRDFRVEGFKGT